MDKPQKLNISPYSAHQATALRRISTAGLVERGFTIIEVMIVLAIAALILLVVFLAVPALQRSQRNNARKSEASRMAASVVSFTSNNATGTLPQTGGAAPSDCATLINDTATLATYSFTLPAACPAAVATLLSSATLTANQLLIVTAPATGNAPAAVTNTMILYDAAQCNGTSGVTATPGRRAALFYSLETGSGWAWGCVNPQ